LGVGYDAVREKNPKVIYLSVSGFGSAGPLRDRPATDTVIQAFSGMMTMNRDASGTPRRTGFLAVDFVSGLYAFQAVSVALFARPFEPEGRHLEVPLVQATASYLNMQLIEARLEGETPRKLNVPAGTYRTKDGWIAVTLTKDEQFAAICAVLERSELGADPRFADFSLRAENEAALLPELREAFLARTTDDWIGRLAGADVFCGRIHSPASWLDDPHVRAAGFAVDGQVPGLPPFPWVRLPGAVDPGPEDARSRWPHLGEHGREILAEELGLSDAEIQGLVARKVLLLPQRSVEGS
jgi:crotonobetainyl-CoA:carnitine CoA-transferase CaiB-like acyl-CoA transferase